MDASPRSRSLRAAIRAEAIVRATRSLGDAGLRVAYLRALIHETPVDVLGRALDAIAARAEQAEAPAREVLVALVDALAAEGSAEIVQRLREEAAGASLLALERLIRVPQTERPSLVPRDPNEAPVPDYLRSGRPLTLGERKAMARTPDRETLQRLLADPHPDVISRLLRNPKLVEDDVVRLATKRPCRPDVLREIARAPRWLHRARVRLALVLNPSTPSDVAISISGLLVRQELRLVTQSTLVPAPIRAVCMEHLERRPPGEGDDEDLPVQ